MDDLSDLKLGCYLPEVLKPVIAFAEILVRREDKDGLFDEGSSQEPLVLAPELDYLAPFESWNMLGNNRYNDCVSVTWANMRRLVTSKLSGRESYPGMDQVMKLYKTQVKGGHPDKGMHSVELLEYLERTGGPDDVRAIASARVNVDINQMRLALAIFGALWVELALDQQNKEEFDYQQPWQVPKESNFLGGHAVLAGGYTKDGSLKVVTWGRVVELSAEFVRKKVKTAYVVIWPEHLGSRRFTRGVDMDRLKKEFKKLKEKEMPLPPSKLNSVLVTYEDRLREYLQVLKIEPDNNLSEDQKYNTETIRALTPIPIRNALNATLIIDNDDLYLIRTEDTPSNHIEIQRVLGPHYYEMESATPIVTAFKCRPRDITDVVVKTGIFSIDNGDLYFIRFPKANAPIRNLEVHWAPHEKRFRSVDKYITGLELPSTFDSQFDRIVVSGGDLYLIARGPTGLEVHCARGYANYSASSVTKHVTSIGLDELSRFFTIGLNGDLYMVKHTKTTGDKAEVWVAKPGDNYQNIQKYVTTIDADDSSSVKVTDLDRRWFI